MHEAFDSPSLAVALALVSGVVAQSIATHLRVPGIVALLAVGVLLGPDVAGLVHPQTLGSGLTVLVDFAVAVILFEGALHLDIQRIRSEGRTIQRLVTLGAGVTWLGGTLASFFFMGWTWRVSLLFGCLVIVTGPTVVGPLLRRFKVQRQVATVLEAEGVLIDPIGAIIAVVALELALEQETLGLVLGPVHVASRLAVGTVVGLIGGALTALALRVRGLVPIGLDNIFALSMALATTQVSNAIVEESGIAAVTIAGMTVSFMGAPGIMELREFKEQLTTMFIGMLFVLLAADVRLDEVRDLGWPGIYTVAALILVVRPLTVFTSTLGSEFTWRQRAFMAWIGPRGIVAAAVASLFSLRLTAAHDPSGPELRAMVFLVIATTVVLAGLSGGLVARLLSVERREKSGWVLLGANEIARRVALRLKEANQEVVCVDVNEQACQAAQGLGIEVVHGDALDERVLLGVGLDSREGVMGITANGGLNLAFAQKARSWGGLERAYVAVDDGESGVTPGMIRAVGASVLFGGAEAVDMWMVRCRQGLAREERWRVARESAGARLADRGMDDPVLPLVVQRGALVRPFADDWKFRPGDDVTVIVDMSQRDVAWRRLADAGFEPTDILPEDEPTAGI